MNKSARQREATRSQQLPGAESSSRGHRAQSGELEPSAGAEPQPRRDDASPERRVVGDTVVVVVAAAAAESFRVRLVATSRQAAAVGRGVADVVNWRSAQN